MLRKKHRIILLLLLPGMLEIIDFSTFMIEIPGSPLGLGRLCFIIAGIFSLSNLQKLKLNKLFYAFIILLFGMYIGVLFGSNFNASLSRTIAFSLLLISAMSISYYWKYKVFQQLLSITMFAMFLYWTIYVLVNLFIGDTLLAYSDQFSEGITLNHHTSGIKISLSGIYIAAYLVGSSKIKNILGYVFLFMTISLCLLIESRSNFLFSALFSFLIFIKNYKLNFKKNFILAIPVLIIVFFYMIDFFSSNEVILRRFDVTNTDYQISSTKSRFVLLSLFLDSFINNPFGRGISDIRLTYNSYSTYFVHNQYLTFVLAGGIFSLLGVIVWVKSIFKLLKLILLKDIRFKISIFDFVLILNVLIFHLTLCTVENTALLFFFQLSFLVYLSSKYRLNNIKLK